MVAMDDAGRPNDDPLLRALDDLVRTAREVDQAVDRLTRRAQDMAAARHRGGRWRDIIDAEERPLIAEMLTETIQQFEAAGTRFRAAKARTLHDEGVPMEQIARMFGVSRQRVSVLLRAPRPRPGQPPATGDTGVGRS